MTGIPVVLGNDRWVNDTYVQVAGYGLRITASDLRHAMAKSADLRVHVSRVPVSKASLLRRRRKPHS